MAAYNSTIGLSFSVTAFFFCVNFFIKCLIDSSIPSIFDNIFISIGFVGVIFFINYMLFEQNDKYLELAEKYDSHKENRTNWFINGFLAFSLALAPILFFIFLL
ncbi:MAG: hypothetical protein Q8O62_00890 [Aequorivita sp.]|nr:hypothetical protein [Aequorivita sp.]